MIKVEFVREVMGGMSFKLYLSANGISRGNLSGDRVQVYSQ